MNPNGPGLAASARPPTVPGELARTRLVERLEERWRVPILTVVAGAGFGKSIALAQAVRAHAACPVGIEAWVSCRHADDPARFNDQIAAALGVVDEDPGPAGDPGRRLRSLVTDLAPFEVCLVLDDVEHLEAAPACLGVIADLLAAGPAHLHVVLAGRRLPPLALARRWAAGQVASIGEDDLRFTPAEVADLGRSVGREPPGGTDDFAGWPALVRLALAAPAGAVREYLLEEVAEGLAGADRRALFTLVTLGRADPATVAAVTGEDFDPGAFVARVPLVALDGEVGTAHDLWSTVVGSLVPAGEAEVLRAGALDRLRGQGEVAAVGSLAAGLGDIEALGWAAVRLIVTRLADFPIELAERWLEQWPVGESPERELLALAVAHRRRVTAVDWPRLDIVVDALAAGGCRERTVAALALAAVMAEAHGDLGRLLALAERARALPETLDHPTLALLVRGVDAARAAHAGDYRAALALLERPVPGLSLAARGEGVTKFHWHVLVLNGRAGEAAALAEATADRIRAGEPIGPVARWLDGDPAPFMEAPVDLLGRGYGGLGDRGRFDRAAFAGVIAASLGRRGIVDEAVAVMSGSGVVPLAPSHTAVLAAARAVQRVVHHDDTGAAAVVRDLVADLTDRSPEERASAEAHLRRLPAVPYVCMPELRERWDADPLGPSDTRARAVARALLEARAGRCPTGEAPAPAGAVLTSLPLPWAVELAARAAAAGACWGIDVARVLAAHAGDALAEELAHLRRSGDDVVASGVTALRAGLRLAPRHTVRIEVLGPLQVRRDGRPVGDPGLRRARVRALLSLLVVEGTVARDVVLDRLWPDLCPERARANLRVTLTHLHAMLEPDRSRGEAPTVVQADATHLRLVPGPGLEVDLHEARAHLTAAARARATGDDGARRAHLTGAVAGWRARPLPDLDAVAEATGAAEEIALALHDAVLTLGELHLVAGEAAEAAACARRALAADPYGERAHRLAVAAATQAGDGSAARAAIESLDKAMSELGVPAEEATARLVRQTARRFGWPRCRS